MSGLSARWVWLPTQRKEDVFARARRVFELDAAPSDATLRITCSGHYRLWVNGRFVGRGPARSNPWKKRYDVLDVAPFLQAGRNVLAVQLIHHGYRTAACPAAPGGFWCQLDAGDLRIESDPDWRLSIDPAYATGTGRRNGCYGIIEIYDARREQDWTAGDFDDATWSRAVLLRDHGHAGPCVSPWHELVPRGIPQCREDSLLPAEVVRVAEVIDQEFQAPDLAHQLLQDIPLAPEYTTIEDARSITTADGGPAVVRQPSPLDPSQSARRCATVILDFGREITGYAWLDIEGHAGAVIDLAYGERLVAGRVQSVVQGVGYADRYILKDGRQRHEVYDWKGFRFLQLTFRELTGPLKLHAAGVTFTSYPVEPAGEFSASDPLLGRIWQTGAYTQQLCMHDSPMDCPWREQQQWLGDGRVQLLIIQNAFGDAALPRKFIEQFAEAQLPSGLLPCVVPGRESSIIDYALWWVSGLLDILRFDGDLAFAARLLPTLQRLLAWFDGHRNADGLLENVPGWVFIDWANVGREGVCAPLNATYVMNLKAAAEVALGLGRADQADEWRAKAEAVRAVFHETFWDDARQLYADNVVAGCRTGMFSLHTQSIAALAGLVQVDAAALLRRALDDSSVVRTEPYFSFYLLETLASAGLAEAGLDFVREKWGAMLEGGATSFWEEWQVDGTFRQGRWLPRPRSHCHAWSAGPTAWLSRYILGVRPDADGDAVIIQPHRAGLERASGVVPTRYGPVSVAWETTESGLRIEWAASPDAVVELREPPGFEGRAEFARR